jgi:hypothetical protein
MTAAELTWIGGALVDHQYCRPMLTNGGSRTPDWWSATALISSEHLSNYASHGSVWVLARRHDCQMVVHASARRREWRPKVCRPRSVLAFATDSEISGGEALAYVAEILTHGEFSEFGREAIHDFAVLGVGGQAQTIEEPEADSIETLNYAKIAGYLPMPSRLEKLVR